MQFVAESTGQQRLFGWMTPSGEFIQSSMFGHAGVVGGSPELKGLVPHYDEYFADVERSRQLCQELSDMGEHPEWHTYDSSEYDFGKYVVGCLYRAGCLRVGTEKGVVYFEGSPQGIQNGFQKAKDLADSYGMAAKFEPRTSRGEY